MMERLTEKATNPSSYNIDTDFSEKDAGGYYVPNMDSGDLEEAIKKLGQLEDIEEELGIDLIAAFKALKDEPYDQQSVLRWHLRITTKKWLLKRTENTALVLVKEECEGIGKPY